MVFWSTAEGPWRVCCVQEMSMTISIRRRKGRSLDAYSTAHWLKSINNKTTQRGARLLVHCKIHCKSIVCSCVWVKYLFPTPCCPPIKDLLCVCMPPCISPCMQESKPLTSRRCWEYSETDLPSCSPYPPPPFFFCIHPPLPFHLPHLSLQCCRSESVCRRGMYVHTNTGRAVISPYANTERLLPRALDSYK